MGLVVGGAASLFGGLMGSSAAKHASDQQAQALQQAQAFQQSVYNTAQGNLQPFVSGGQNALGALQQLYGLAPAGSGGGGNALQSYQNFTKTPFYQFPLSQGVSALNASGAAKGLSLSGGQLNALQQYGQGYASSNFQNYINALSGLANLGQGAAGSLAGSGNQAASTTTGIQSGFGNALAAGTVGSQNQLNNALGAIPGLLGYGGNNSGSSYGSGNSGNNTGGSSLFSGIGNAFSGLFGSGYTGPSANALQQASSPTDFQNALSLSPNQFVP